MPNYQTQMKRCLKLEVITVFNIFNVVFRPHLLVILNNGTLNNRSRLSGFPIECRNSKVIRACFRFALLCSVIGQSRAIKINSDLVPGIFPRLPQVKKNLRRVLIG